MRIENSQPGDFFSDGICNLHESYVINKHYLTKSRSLTGLFHETQTLVFVLMNLDYVKLSKTLFGEMKSLFLFIYNGRENKEVFPFSKGNWT